MALNETQHLIEQLRAGRRKWIEVAPGKHVRIVRPPETALHEFVTPGEANGMQAGMAQVVRYVDGWRDITQADLLGAAIGADEPAEFSPELWAEVVADRRAWMQAIGAALINAMVEHETAKQGAAKN